MGCSSCKKWVVSLFNCLDCTQDFTYQHREADNPVSQVLFRSGRCTNCHSKNFVYKGPNGNNA